ncbi:hypothetical protein AUEXF2481DRAFT_29898 [Aureobasidium subglaciale EXF-2481]|uniref:HPt domain-containing protein n=1 Tax=Aureobasidium subglaciale (strain EXF-2481) TaxID=1043005 RepID=A0A074Z8P5_AURSE|nr:uncharacterized protein AUEXF2481DRAFT_29898 [Aureobasidium subglaciale EXF-2481]KAI5196869.1 hypothetical protein E4T38_08286 [Aureobasidium subglaciale]KAI5215575.1 hypothetical protein E4T40_08311 [Aureobasidium subglaciale]KAI5218825.1 hypothetical protein E4T41_08226 [Aureobasidium subglaciale]KAI5256505.1 hypothetical protein E4T46_08202 [Aureobasidium subglaciale]KEQ95181.1 hypothetical protein AUEXF2481DRAFT_29898 [Aureobasidium subglaciale EXF-2481]
MLQHAQMAHAFQSTTTGGRTYQISKLPELDYAINTTIFREILELDDEDEQYFTRSLVCDFITLAQRTFTEMDACLETQDVKQLWSKARYLRGPSATLGVYKVESSCARIEQMTAIHDSLQTESDSKSTLCNSARIVIDQAQQHFAEAENALRLFYGMD